ncbi:MAG: patatin-like phospholipase family protein [Bacillota bacterium]
MNKPKIGLALGSGGARGFAHLGVLKAFKDEDIPVDMIAGSSMGALAACFYGVGHNMEDLYKLSTAFRRKYYLDFTVPKMGFIAGKRIKQFVRLFTHNKNIEDLTIPISVVATDLTKGERVVFTEGPIAEAVRASISIPGIFVPEKINGRLLVDGGVIDRVPVSVVEEMGADIVIGVDVAQVKQNAEIVTVYDVIMQSIDILQKEIIRNRELHADFMIRPNVEQYSSRAFTNTEEIIAAGEEEAKKIIPSIRQAIEEWKGKQQ